MSPYTLADAIRDEFERTHPHGKNTLLCEQCRQRKDREDFRETPWRGRAAACKSCEGMRWTDCLRLQQEWKLEQERERGRMYRRYISYLRLRRIFDVAPRSAGVIRALEEPYIRAVERASERWTRAIAFAVEQMEER